jgi:hypothetical protein
MRAVRSRNQVKLCVGAGGAVFQERLVGRVGILEGSMIWASFDMKMGARGRVILY